MSLKNPTIITIIVGCFVLGILYCLLWASVTAFSQSTTPHHIKLLSYNIDGLNTFEIQTRTNAIIKLILEESPDILHLQEVVHETYSLLQAVLADHGYECSGLSEAFSHYFTMSAVKKSRFSRIKFELKEFSGDATSDQGRFLLLTTALLDNRQKCSWINFHLESMGDSFVSPQSNIRIAQLKMGLQYFQASGERSLVLISGDLNIRDDEAEAIFMSHPLIADAAQVLATKPVSGNPTGRSPDPTFYRPNNPSDFRRYDRVYFLPSRLEAITVQTIGHQALWSESAFSFQPTYLTPSDHRGLVVTFAVR